MVSQAFALDVCPCANEANAIEGVHMLQCLNVAECLSKTQVTKLVLIFWQSKYAAV